MQKTATILFLILAVFFGACKAQNVGTNNNNNLNANTNDNDNSNLNNNSNVNTNTNTSGELTHRIMTVQTAKNIMGYDLNRGPNCPLRFQDVGNTGEDEELCWAIDLISRLRPDFNLGFADGMFRPEDHVNRAEKWWFKVNVVGFVPYIDDFIVPDVQSDAWYAKSFGALAAKNLIIYNPVDGWAHPEEMVTLDEWAVTVTMVNEYLNRTLTMETWIESFATNYHDHPWSPESNCQAWFEVPADSPLCYAVMMLMDMGYLDPGQSYIDPERDLPWGESIGAAVEFNGFDNSECTGCSGISSDQWQCGDADALCERSLLPNGFSINLVPTLKELNRYHYDMLMYYNSHST